MSSSGESSPVCSPEPENVACYEECITDDTFVSAGSPAGAVYAGASVEPTLHQHQHGIPKASTSGRITKRARTRPKSLKNRKCSSPLILQWLGENYEMVPGSCLPRSVLYTHYQDFCKKNAMEASSAASFGKIIRMKFPDLSTRRLGTRGQSKYHYYGLAIKETSIYYRSVYSKKGLTRFSGAASKRENGQTYNPSSKTGILLPNFPKISELNFTNPFPVDKVETFLIMYKAHSQRILDSVVRANFQEVQDFLVHFWQGMPTHMLPILGCQATVDLVVVCDFILYRALCEVLIPASLQSLPENLLEEIVVFSHNIVEWVFNALQDLPAALGIRKVQTCEMFGKSLRRQTALVQLAKGVRAMLRNSDEVASLLQDWRTVDVESLILQPEACNTNTDLFRELAHELEQLFIKQSSLEVYFEWLDSIIEKQISEPSERGLSLVQLSHEFVTSWTSFYSLLDKHFSSISAKSIEHYNGLYKLMDEYIHYVIELLQAQAIEVQYNEVLRIPRSSTQLGSLPPPLPLQYHPDVYPGEDDPRLVLPPTPDSTPLPHPSSSSSDRDLFASLHHSAKQLQCSDLPHHQHHQHSVNYFTGDLHGSFIPGAPEGLCDGFIKPEYPTGGYKCGHFNMSGLSQTHNDSPMNSFQLDTATPLTPQSSHYSGGSPLSHVSLSASPEPPPFFPVSSAGDQLDLAVTTAASSLPPHSIHHHQHHQHHHQHHMVTTSPVSGTSVCSPSGMYHQQTSASVVLAQGYAGENRAGSDLDIVRSLELITGEATGHISTSPALSPAVDASLYHPPPSSSSSLSPISGSHTPSPSADSSCSTSPVHVSSYDQYEFELLQLMSNPDDLLADPKMLLQPIPTPIH